MKSSTLGRTVELLKLAVKVGLKEIRSGDTKSRLEQAVLIARSLSNLKGAAMKAGQLLSLDLISYFPPEAVEILSQLQSSASAHPVEQMQNQLRKELGKIKLSKIRNLSRQPIGIASIGQVHRAQYKDQEIILKIQYPGVAGSINSDLKILKRIATSFCQLTGRKMDLDPLFLEFKRMLVQEVDYRSEAEFQKEYRSLIGSIRAPGGFAYEVPEIVDELSTARVISMNFVEGVSLRSWIQSKPSQQKKERLGLAILDLYFHEFFEWGLVQTDPNLANFLVRDTDDVSTLVLLDFGATRRYTREFILNYVRLLQLATEKKSKQLREHAIEFGLLDRRESDSGFAAFEAVLETSLIPFSSDSLKIGYFDFADQSYLLNAELAAKMLSKELVYSAPPYEIVFLHRKLAGVYSVLKSLGVRLDVSRYWERIVQCSKTGV